MHGRRTAEICAVAARRAGLRPDDLEWVRLGERAVLRLDGGRVIARVERPGVAVGEARAEIAVARWLAANGVPVTHPLPVEQPIVADDVVVTFWYGIRGGPGNLEQLAELLRLVHALTPPADFDRPARPFLRLENRLIAAPGLIDAERERLKTVLEAARAGYHAVASRLTPGFVHGDAAVHNVLSTSDGPVLFDFEYAGRGHVEWDLAQTAAYREVGWLSAADHAAFVRSYGRDVRDSPGYAVLRRVRLLRELTGLAQRHDSRGDPVIRAEIARRVTVLECDGPPGAWTHFAPHTTSILGVAP